MDKERIMFGKRVVDVVCFDGKMRIVFVDGIEVGVDGVVGCDGVKFKVREVLMGMLGEGRERGKCGYSGKYVYWCLVLWGKVV